MSDKAMEFSRRGDEQFSRLLSRFPTAAKRRLALGQPLPADRFSAIQAATRAYISECLGFAQAQPEDEVITGLLRARAEGRLHNYTPGGMLIPKREHAVAWNQLHRTVAAAFSDFGIGDLVDGIDLPINVRLVFGETNNAKPAAFSSSKLHSDVWAGVPHDAVVCVLPVLGAIEHLTIVFGEMKRELEMSQMRAMNDYDEGSTIKMDVPDRDTVLQHGTFYAADVRLLHKTVRRKKMGARVSIDFRFRMHDPIYRAMVPPVIGPESVDTRVPYETWLGVGTDRLMVIDETMAEAAATRHLKNSLPVYDGPYRIVPLYPGVPAGGRETERFAAGPASAVAG
jgi:hypothetical protein